MKKLITIILLGVLYQAAYAQKIIEKKLPFSASQLVNLNLKFADDIKVEYWDKPEVYVRIEVEINSGKLNEALVVDSKSTSNEISLKTDFDNDLLKTGKAEDCPNRENGHHSSWNSDGKQYWVCSKINYQVFLPKQAALALETINGNIWINSVNSNSIKAKTISGFVDVNWPKGKGGNLGMKTITGEVYSDLDIALKGEKQKNPIVGYLLEGTVNGGGPRLQVESISNNVYVRSKN